MVTTFVSPLLLTVEFVFALLLAGYLLYRYANIRRQNPFATVTTLVVWFLSFVIIFLLPVDVSSVRTSRKWRRRKDERTYFFSRCRPLSLPPFPSSVLPRPSIGCVFLKTSTSPHQTTSLKSTAPTMFAPASHYTQSVPSSTSQSTVTSDATSHTHLCASSLWRWSGTSSTGSSLFCHDVGTP